MSEEHRRFDRRALRKLAAAQLGLVLLLVSGCATEIPNIEPPTPRRLGAEFETFSAAATGNEPAKKAPFTDPDGELTLRRSLASALLQNPSLAAFSIEMRVREAEALQAGLLPNPAVTLEAENFAGNGDYQGSDRLETTIFLGQLIELGGKRVRRRRVAELERDLAGWDYEVRRLDVLTEVAMAFIRVLEAQRRVALADELLAIASQSLDAVTKQVRAGATSAVEQTRAEVRLASTRVDRRRSRAELEIARSRLAATWGAKSARFTRVAGDFQTAIAPPPLERIRDGLSQNPDIARWATELAHREALVSLADARAIPDITAGGGVRRLEETRDTALVFGVTIPLPVFDRNQGTREARRHGLAKLRYEQRDATVRAAAELEVAYEELRSRFEELEALREQVLPQAARALDDVQAGYLHGLFRYLDVLDAQRTLFELRDQKLEALGAYHRSVAAVERLIGAPLFGAEAAPSPSPLQEGTR